MDNRLIIELCNELDNSQMYKQANEIEELYLKTSQNARPTGKIKLTPQQLQTIKQQPTLEYKKSALKKLVDFLTGKPSQPSGKTPNKTIKPNVPEPINPRPEVLRFDGSLGSGIQQGSFEEWKKFLESPGVEGGYSNYGKHIDPGGKTNLGITQDNMDEYTTRHKIPRVDVKKLTTDSEIYKDVLKEYWSAIRADGLPKHTAAAIADFTFNSNRANAMREVQKELIRNGQDIPLTGKMDDATKQAIWNLVQHDPYKDFLLARQIGKARLNYVYNLQFKTVNGKREINKKMKSVVDSNMKGWFNRIQKLVNMDPYNINVKHEFDPTKYGLKPKIKPPVKKKSKLKIEVPDKPQFKPKPFTV